MSSSYMTKEELGNYLKGIKQPTDGARRAQPPQHIAVATPDNPPRPKSPSTSSSRTGPGVRGPRPPWKHPGRPDTAVLFPQPTAPPTIPTNPTNASFNRDIPPSSQKESPRTARNRSSSTNRQGEPRETLGSSRGRQELPPAAVNRSTSQGRQKEPPGAALNRGTATGRQKELPPNPGSVDELMNDLTLADPPRRGGDAFDVALARSGTSSPKLTSAKRVSLPSVPVPDKPLPPVDHSAGGLAGVSDERVTVRGPMAFVDSPIRCAGCSEPIIGRIMTALGKQWHAEHFVCRQCGTSLEHVEFQEKDGVPYCHLDFHELFSPRCDYCKTPIEDECVAALGKTYHRLHFFCRECGNPFEGGFMVHDGHPYCEKDYLNKFGKKCKGCDLHIRGEFTNALGEDWHKTCFVCTECKNPFDGGAFYVRNNRPFCEAHLRSAVAPLPAPPAPTHICDMCQNPIAGRAVIALGKKFHQEHFACVGCDRELSTSVPGMWRVNESGDRPICLECLSGKGGGAAV